MKKNLLFVFAATLMIAACSNLDDQPGDIEFNKQKAVTRNNTSNGNKNTSVSLEEAISIANRFYREQGAIQKNKRNNKSAKYTSPTTNIIKEGDIPAMYVINYPNGGFVIVGASKDYYPILAYSDEGTFDLTLEDTGISNWVAETKDAIKNSSTLCDSMKNDMKVLWNSYSSEKIENNTINTPTRGNLSAAEIACYERCEDLLNQYGYEGDEGWHFQPLSTAEQAFAEAGYSGIYQNLCYSANYNHSPANTSVVGWKICTLKEEVDALIGTKWSQGAPFNNLMSHDAGCGPIAFAQVMRYYEYPQILTYNGYSMNLNNIPHNPSNGNPSDYANLVKMVYEELGTTYVNLPLLGEAVYTTPEGMENGIEKFGYNVSSGDHSFERVQNEILKYKRPVIMLGNDTNLSALPEPLNYIGNSHFWVCDGCKKTTKNRLFVFTEWQPYGNGDFVPGWYSMNNPDVQGGVVFSYYHMNWGWGGTYNGWFADNSMTPGSHDFEHSRKDFYIIKP